MTKNNTDRGIRAQRDQAGPRSLRPDCLQDQGTDPHRQVGQTKAQAQATVSYELQAIMIMA